MTFQQVFVRLPWGTEVWFGDTQPRIGDRLSRRGTVFVVKLIENEGNRLVVRVAPYAEEPEAAAGP